ncbi:MAG TPA: hypothetical protein VLH56_08925 [Dissulfurispiraceae bacterium]|nr:hypothetical protein [Dissulfurispiraceae bacterium]
MADIPVVVASIRPLNNAVIRRGQAAEALTPGQAVYLDGANGWRPTDADFIAAAQGRGVVISDSVGSVAFAAGSRVDIVTYGPVTGFTGMTPGGAVFNSVNAGVMDQVAPALQGDFPYVMGYAESAVTIFVNPQVTIPVVNP